MISRSRLLGLLILLADSPAAALADDAMPHRFKSGKSVTGIPFELNSNKIFLRVQIDGGEPRSFILDSGCPVTAIDMALARALKLPVENPGEINGVGEGRTAIGTTKIGSLNLAGLELFPKSVLALGVHTPVSPYEGRRIDGLLGVDFLEQFVVRIDYRNRKLDVVLPESHRPAANGIVVPLEKNGGHYTVKGTLRLKNGQMIEGTFIVDVGVRLPLLVSTPFVNRNRLLEAAGAGPLQTVGGGLGGETRAHLARIESLTIGDLKVAAPFIALSQEKRSFLAGDDVHGLLGAEIFRRYCFTLDLPGKRMIFEESPETKTPYEFDMSGMFLVAHGDDFHRFTVLSVVDGSPAAAAGIRSGDIIVELDGQSTAKLTLEQLRSAFRDPGATRELTLNRQNERLTVKLHLRRMV